MELFTINHLSFAYPEQEKQAISDLTLSVRPGEFLVLCGPSGCGKSTLLRQLKTVLAPHGRRSGEILFDGRNLDSLDQREQAEKIGFVQQSRDVAKLADVLGHSSIETTRIYLMSTGKEYLRQLDKLGLVQ